MNGVFAGEFRRLRRHPDAEEVREIAAIPAAAPTAEEGAVLRRTAVLPTPEPDLDSFEQKTGYRDRRRVSLLE